MLNQRLVSPFHLRSYIFIWLANPEDARASIPIKIHPTGAPRNAVASLAAKNDISLSWVYVQPDTVSG